MSTQTLESPREQAPETAAPDLGVIREARRRRRRERATALLVVLGSIGAGLLLVSGGGGAGSASASSTKPHWLVGTPLSRSNHLRLLVSENGGPATIVDVASGHVQAVPGLGLPRKYRLWSPMVWPLIKVPGGALGVVHRRSCNRCIGTETHFLITASGSVRRISSLRLTPNQTTAPVLGSTSASWVLSHHRGGRCTLRVEPSPQPAVPSPCGDLVYDPSVGAGTPAGVTIWTTDRTMLFNPQRGKVIARSPLGGNLDVLNGSYVLTSGPPGVLRPLTLMNLRSGAQTRLRWPSTLHYGYSVFPEPHSSTVAVEFADPAYHGGPQQASDVWLLNTRSDTFTHVPGFPILENLKFSDLAWATDHSLVLVAQGGGRTAVGVWRPGSRQLEVRRVPALSGYSEIVPFEG